MNPTRTDCLVIGAGAAGAVYAVQAARAGLHVTLITGAAELTASNSLWAQGGIIFDEGDGDLLRADIDAASGHSANPAAVDAIVRDGPRLVRELLIDDLQVNFDRDTDGALKFTREASHSRHRIIFAKDHTGRAILTALHERLAELAAAGTLPGGGSLTVATGCFAVDLLTLSHSSVDFLDRYRPLSCIGAYVLDIASGEVRAIVAKKTVLATGGLGQLYLHSTNDAGAYGHGVAMAYRVGARVIDMEYVQFHPDRVPPPRRAPVPDFGGGARRGRRADQPRRRGVHGTLPSGRLAGAARRDLPLHPLRAAARGERHRLHRPVRRRRRLRAQPLSLPSTPACWRPAWT